MLVASESFITHYMGKKVTKRYAKGKNLRHGSVMSPKI